MKNNTVTTEATLQTSNDLRHTISVNDPTGNYSIKIRLNDECKNGHQDFSITATFWEIGKFRNDRNLIKAGCCHEEILKVRPDLQIFVNLHLCDYTGVPMYAVANGFYHIKNGFNNTPTNAPNFADKFCKYYRVTQKQFGVLRQCENKLRYAIQLDKLGILEQWRVEADKAISILENWTRKKFLIDSPKCMYTRPTSEQIAEEDAKTADGYYTPENIQKRAEEAEKTAKNNLYEQLENELKKQTEKAQLEYNVKKAVLDAGLHIDNFIFYNHTKTGVFNWLDYKKRITKGQFDTFIASVKIEGVKFELN